MCGALWYVSRGALGAWPLAIGLLPAAGRLVRRQPIWPSTPFDGLLILFLFTAGVAVWAAYDRPAAWGKFWLIVGATLLFYALARQPQAQRWRLAGLWALFGVGVAFYFLLTHDWQAIPAKIEAFNRLATRWSAWRPAFTAHDLHPNVAGGLLALSLPWQMAVIARAWRGRRGWWVGAASVGGMLTLVGLLLTTSRGAWLALVAGLAVWVAWAVTAWLRRRGAAWVARAWAILALLLLAAGGVWLGSAPEQAAALADRLPGPASAGSRLDLMRDTWALVKDVPFTGAGLGAFPGWYSHYVRVIPHFYLIHSHNIGLDIWLEQGPWGAAAWLVLLAGAIWLILKDGPRLTPNALWRGAWLASMTVLLAHGGVEDALYGSRAALLLWVLPGMALSEAGGEAAIIGRGGHGQAAAWWTAAALGVGFLLLLAATQHGPAAWWANRGALAMARVELANFPAGLWSDGSEAARLDSAESLFQHALSLQPDNPTAHYRLGLMAGLRRDWRSAAAHLALAYQQAPGRRGLRKSLGYAYAWLGEEEKSAELLRAIPEASDELAIYAWWWPTQGYPELSAPAQAVNRLLNP